MPKYWVRTNCEYVTEVDAEDERSALVKADRIPLEDWEKAWSTLEAEEVESLDDLVEVSDA